MNVNPTVEQLRALLRACDDMTGHHVLWVSRRGEVQITRLANETAAHWAGRLDDEIQFRYETYHLGNGYVGEKVADDLSYVSLLFQRMETDWAEDRRGYLDF